MKISMKQCEGSSTAHEIEVGFKDGAGLKMTISGTETAIDVYKAIILAYERGEEDNANFHMQRGIQALADKARGRG